MRAAIPLAQELLRTKPSKQSEDYRKQNIGRLQGVETGREIRVGRPRGTAVSYPSASGQLNREDMKYQEVNMKQYEMALGEALESMEFNVVGDLLKKGQGIIDTVGGAIEQKIKPAVDTFAAAARVVKDPKKMKQVKDLAQKNSTVTPLDTAKDAVVKSVIEKVKADPRVEPVIERGKELIDQAGTLAGEVVEGSPGKFATKVALYGGVPTALVGGGAIWHGMANRKKKLSEGDGEMQYAYVLSDILNEVMFEEEKKKKPASKRGIIERVAPYAGAAGGAMGGAFKGGLAGGVLGTGAGVASSLVGNKGKLLATALRRGLLGGLAGGATGTIGGGYVGGVTGHARGQLLQKQLEENRIANAAKKAAKKK